MVAAILINKLHSHLRAVKVTLLKIPASNSVFYWRLLVFSTGTNLFQGLAEIIKAPPKALHSSSCQLTKNSKQHLWFFSVLRPDHSMLHVLVHAE